MLSKIIRAKKQFSMVYKGFFSTVNIFMTHVASGTCERFAQMFTCIILLSRVTAFMILMTRATEDSSTLLTAIKLLSSVNSSMNGKIIRLNSFSHTKGF